MRHPKRVSKRATGELAGFQADLIPPSLPSPPKGLLKCHRLNYGPRKEAYSGSRWHKGGDKILIARSFSFPFFFFFLFRPRGRRYRGGERSLVTMRTTSSSSILTKPRVLYERHGHYSFQRELWTGICYQGPYFAPVHAFFFDVVTALENRYTQVGTRAESSTILTKIHRDNRCIAAYHRIGLLGNNENYVIRDDARFSSPVALSIMQLTRVIFIVIDAIGFNLWWKCFDEDTFREGEKTVTVKE